MKDMTYTYKLEIEKKHPILVNQDGKRFLVDTGSPITMAKPFSLCGRMMIGGTTALMGTIRNLSGLNVDGLIGLDILKKYHVVIDYANGQILFSKQPFAIKGERLPMNRMLGTIGFDATINGQPCKVILDTGAQISYVNASLVEGDEIVGHDTDFYPGLGTFDVELHRVALQIGDAGGMTVTVGVLPGLLACVTALVGQSIIGYDLLSKAQVELDFENVFITIAG